MTVLADYSRDGTIVARDVEVTGYHYPQTPLVNGDTQVIITYTEGGVTRSVSQSIICFTATIDITVGSNVNLTITDAQDASYIQTLTTRGRKASVRVNRASTFQIIASKNGETKNASVVVTEATSYPITITGLYSRYGFKKAKNESLPAGRVEYIYDAVGMTPAHMDFANGVFDYGSWGDEWFVTENKPCMLKYDGTVDYYLNPNDYTLREDGETPSDVADTEYAGNAMAQFPLCYFYRYEDEDYEYEIVSDGPYDSNYKAYAHTDADGNIKDYFYWSMFGGSGNATQIRSLKDQSLARSLNATNEIAGCSANGTGWYTHTWSQRCYITTLLVLMGKSTNTQAIYGIGNCRNGNESNLLTTGTLYDKGQFFGYNTNTYQVKVFHVEKFWGDQWDRTAGLIVDKGAICVKMTPEGTGYRVNDVNGYTDTGLVPSGSYGSYIRHTNCSEYGCIPYETGGSDSTYECDPMWFNNSQLTYLLCGATAYNAAAQGGAFTFGVASAPSAATWHRGCGLSKI